MDPIIASIAREEDFTIRPLFNPSTASQTNNVSQSLQDITNGTKISVMQVLFLDYDDMSNEDDTRLILGGTTTDDIDIDLLQ